MRKMEKMGLKIYIGTHCLKKNYKLKPHDFIYMTAPM